MRSRIMREFVRLLILLVVIGLTSTIVSAQGCPQQVCRLTGECYDCNSSPNTTEGCSIKVGDCTECTNWICDGDPPEDPPISSLNPNQGLEWAASIETACQQTALSNAAYTSIQGSTQVGTQISLARFRKGAPAALVVGTFGVEDLFLGGKLLNLGKKTIFGYRVGWVEEYPDSRAKASMGPWINVPAGISPGSTYAVPAQRVSPDALRMGATFVKFFVAELKFTDGSVWKENLGKIRKSAARNDGAGS